MGDGNFQKPSRPLNKNDLGLADEELSNENAYPDIKVC